MIFDKASSEEAKETCAMLLRDLCALACGDPAVWLPVSKLEQCFAFDLIVEFYYLFVFRVH